MIELIRGLKFQYSLNFAGVNNERRELTDYRIQQFKLGTFIDFFVSSCFVHYRKPDAHTYQIALDNSQMRPKQVVYIDDRPMFFELAQDLAFRGIIHIGYGSTKKTFETSGLSWKN